MAENHDRQNKESKAKALTQNGHAQHHTPARHQHSLTPSPTIQFNTIDLLKRMIPISLFPISGLNLSLNLIQFLLSLFLSPRTAKSTFRSRICWRFSLSTNAQSLCLDLFSLSTMNKKALLQQTLCPTLPQFPGGQNGPTHDLPSIPEARMTE